MRDIPSLQNLILLSFPYTKLKQISTFQKYARIRGILDFSWEVWREKARLELGIPYEFFDLYTDVSGNQRYLIIHSYFHLDELSTVRIANNSVEGVYESLAGVYEAVNRKSEKGLDTFLPRLDKYGKIFVKELITKNTLSDEQEKILAFLGEKTKRLKKERKPFSLTTYLLGLSKEELEKEFQQLLDSNVSREDILIRAIEVGKVDLVDKVLAARFPETNGLRVADVPIIPFNELPTYRNNINLPMRYFIPSILFSCNPQIYDFFIQGPVHVSLKRLADGYKIHRNVLGAYAILTRILLTCFQSGSIYIIKTGNLDLINLLYNLSNRRTLLQRILLENLGNVPVITAYASLFSKNTPFLAVNREKYPLSVYLVENS